MTDREFVLRIVETTAWPVTTIVLALLFWSPVKHVLVRLAKLKIKDVLEFEIKDELAQIAAVVGTSAQGDAKPPSPPPGVVAVAEVAPRAAIPLSWANVETALREAVNRLGDTSLERPLYDPIRRANYLRRFGLDADTAEAIFRLKDLRDRVARGEMNVSEITETEAWRYGEIAAAVIQKIDQLPRAA